VTNCPRCGERVAAGQEYCLECGLRLPGDGRVGAAPPNRRTGLTILLAGVIAVGGAALAIALTREPATATAIVTATGGSEVVSTPTVTGTSQLEEWPANRSAWTVILISVPKVDGRDAAVARAGEARQKGLGRVGVLDSSRFASLHPGYWMVYAGVYPSEPEAASRLREAKAVQRGARIQRIGS
jgi:hypothetical protein